MVDNDRGMAAEAMQHVGTPFFTTRDRRTGLGVVLARAAFEQYGGTLEYRSAPGQSTTVLGILARAPAGVSGAHLNAEPATCRVCDSACPPSAVRVTSDALIRA